MKPFRVSIMEMPLMEGNGKNWGQKSLERLIRADILTGLETSLRLPVKTKKLAVTSKTWIN